MNECEHLAQLRRFLAENGLRVWGEHSEGGWVNVYCDEVVLKREAEESQ